MRKKTVADLQENHMTNGRLEEYLLRDLTELLPLDRGDAEQVVAKLADQDVYMLSAAMTFFGSVQALDDSDVRHRRIRVLCTFFVIEAFVHVLNDEIAEPWKRFAWLIKNYLRDDETVSLLCGFVFAEPDDINARERKPLYHVMRSAVVKDTDWLRKNVLGTLKATRFPEGEEWDKRAAEEAAALQEHIGPVETVDLLYGQSYVDYRECTAPCDCAAWLKHHLDRKDKFLNVLTQRVYELRNAMAHHGFPVHFGVIDGPGLIVDRCVWRSESGALRATSFAVKMTISELTNILETSLARALVEHTTKEKRTNA